MTLATLEMIIAKNGMEMGGAFCGIAEESSRNTLTLLFKAEMSWNSKRCQFHDFYS